MSTQRSPRSSEPPSPPFPGRWAGPVVGLLVVGAALGTAQLAAAVVRASSPVVAVGDAVVDLSPTWLVETAIGLFGTADKAVLLAGVVVLLALSGCALGTVALRRPAAGYAGLAVFAAAGLAATWVRRADDPGAALPVVCAALAGAAALAVLLRSLGGPTAGSSAGPGAGEVEDRGADAAAGESGAGGGDGTGERAEPEGTGGRSGTDGAGEAAAGTAPTGTGRRFVLTAAGVLAASGAAGALGLRLPSLLGGPAGQPALALPAAAEPLPALPAGTDLGIPGLAPFTTPADDFYRIDTALSVPRIDASQWVLRIHGMVDRPFEIDMDELLGLPLVEADITLSCVSNPVGGQLVGNTRWLGHPLADLLRRAGVHAGADQILSTSQNGWTCGTPTETVMDGRDALLAVGMEGRPLPYEHGFPARMIVPGLFGYVSATKWVTDIKLTRFADEDAYWVDRGWAERGPVKTMSRVDVPGDFTRTAAGDVVLAGVAWSQHTGIEAVEVRVDDGEWRPAELARVPGPDTWVQWVAETRVGPGMHAVEVRATDATGYTQSSEEVETIPDGAEGRHRIRFTAE
ncbi:molybdopterin-dependent oxidoreductase [Nocardiopsis sp. CT-R113]|uniref:Molybdopterin-dependent oxidoreductase n=1 Tax=Nocardiopsis codii TaxID=3065942 RepID=A0ABU7K9Y5_9ACTN|nr:molybdopterin-dependent oxidoreductase [Nocardiopsis sp. CT-R113]MEE2039046.1 molybdopterin-dependent oxidoreductase [Nocardiopsis sp. CT-R113]